MGRVLGQPPAAANKETMLAVDKTTPADRCGFPFAAFSCPA